MGTYCDHSESALKNQRSPHSRPDQSKIETLKSKIPIAILATDTPPAQRIPSRLG